MDERERRGFMQRAIELALDGVRRNEGGPFGAVVVRAGELVAGACNRVTSTNDPTAHAEIVAIRAACAKLASFELADCEIFTTCEPCPMCFAAIHWARIPRVHFACSRDDAARAGFDDALLYDEIAKPPAERRITLEPLMRDEALETFRAWLAKPDRNPY